MYQNKQPLSYGEVLPKLMKYCSYQERSIYEVKQKLREYRVKEADQEQIIKQLQQEKFIDELRFAEIYVRGKVKVKKWGVFKIREGLASKGIYGELANTVLKDIDADVYRRNLEELIEKKTRLLGEDEKRREKLYRFLQSKGYESDLIQRAIKDLH